MNHTTATEQDIVLTGKSGQPYYGKIFSDKQNVTEVTGRAIAILSNSQVTEDGWQHQVNSIYNAENIKEEIAHFQSRDDISHLILLPYSSNENDIADKVDDLIRGYLHG